MKAAVRKAKLLYPVLLLTIFALGANVLAEDQPPAPDADTLLLLPMDENAGETVDDASSNGFAGELMNGAKWTTGRFGSAIHFDGVDDYVTIQKAFPEVTHCTAEAWINLDRLPAAQGVVIKNSGFWGLSVEHDGRLFCAWWDSGVNNYFWGNKRLVPGEWYHIATTYDGPARTMRLFINGELDRTVYYGGGQGRVPSGTVQIGAAYDGTSSQFPGIIDEVCISSVAKTFGAAITEEKYEAEPALPWRPTPPRHELGLVERLHSDDTPAPVPTAEERTKGYLVFSRHYMDLIFPNSVPHRDEVVTKLSVFASPGEYEPVTFAIYALRDLTGVRVMVSDLRSADGTQTIPQDLIDVRRARCTFKRTTHYSGPGEFMYMPTWLSQEETTNIPAQQSAWFWLDVHVPPECESGTYTGWVRVASDDEGASVLPLELEVLPVGLTEITDMCIGFYDDVVADKFFPMEKRFADMRAFGMTSVAYVGDSGIGLSLEGDQLRVDIANSGLARVMHAYQAAGFSSPLQWLAGQDIWNWCARQADVDSERFARLYVDIHRAIRKKVQEEDWPEIIIQPEDECASVPEKWRRAIAKLPLLKEAGFRTEMNQLFAYPNAANTAAREQVLPFTDVINISFSMKKCHGRPPWPECAARVAALNKVLWTYNIDGAMSWPQPTSYRFYTGFFFRTLAPTCQGMYFWMYASVIGDPYTDLDGLHADQMYYYPEDPARGLSGGPSLTLVYMREGIDDLRYIQTLERLIASASRSGRPDVRQAAGRAQQRLARILQSFKFTWAKEWDRPHTPERCDSSWDVSEERDGMKIAGGKFIYRNGWDFADYDRARRAIAQEIIKLQRTREQQN